MLPKVFCCSSQMLAGTANGPHNPNAVVWNSPGIWLTYVIIVAFMHFIFLSMPWFSTPVVWTLTNVIHDVVMYFFLHGIKGTPFETSDQGKYRYLTHWEQMDSGTQFTAARKFFMTVPIVMYCLASFYTKYEFWHFLLNTAALLITLLPKLPQLHGVRFFGINKY